MPLLQTLSYDARLGSSWKSLPPHGAALVPTDFDAVLHDEILKDEKSVAKFPAIGQLTGGYEIYYYLAAEADHPLLSRRAFDKTMVSPSMASSDTILARSCFITRSGRCKTSSLPALSSKDCCTAIDSASLRMRSISHRWTKSR